MLYGLELVLALYITGKYLIVQKKSQITYMKWFYSLTIQLCTARIIYFGMHMGGEGFGALGSKFSYSSNQLASHSKLGIGAL